MPKQTRNSLRMCIRWSKTWNPARPLRFADCFKRLPLNRLRSRLNNDNPKMDALFHSGGYASAPRTGPAWRRIFPWWDSPIANGLELTDAQRTQIRSVTGDFRGRMMEVRDAVRKAENDLDAVFNEDSVDQR